MLGLQGMQHKSAQTTLNIFKDMLNYISSTCDGVGWSSNNNIHSGYSIYQRRFNKWLKQGFDHILYITASSSLTVYFTGY